MAPDAVDEVVACHEILRAAFLHADFEALQIDLAQGALGDAGIVAVAVRLLVVAGEVLRTGGDAVFLDAAHNGRRRASGDERILGEVFEVAAAQRIAVNVHAGRKQHVAALFDHLAADRLVQALNENRVPRAGQSRAAGQQGGVILQPDAGGAVRRCDGRHAERAQALRDAAHDGGVAFCAERAVHGDVAAAERVEILGSNLCEKIVKRCQTVRDVAQTDTAVAGEGDRGGQIVEDAAAQRTRRRRHGLIDGFPAAVDETIKGMGGRGRTDLLQLADNAELRYGHTAAQRGTAHIGAGVNAVFACLKHPGGLVSCHASVVVACERGEREGERERFRFAGSEHARFAEGGEHAGGFSENTLRRAAVYLHDLPAGERAGIFRRHPYADRVALRF